MNEFDEMPVATKRAVKVASPFEEKQEMRIAEKVNEYYLGHARTELGYCPSQSADTTLDNLALILRGRKTALNAVRFLGSIGALDE